MSSVVRRRDRDRQAGQASSSNRSKGSVQSSSKRDHFVDSASERKLLFIFVFFFIVLPAISVIAYRITNPPETKRRVSNLEPRALAENDLGYEDILRDHSRVSENTFQRHFTYPVLAYITPWNSRGYDLAKKFNSKFTHLSPVWYDLKSQGNNLILEGRHNADKGWMSDLRRTGEALLLPRVVLEALPTKLLKKKGQRDRAIDLIVTECKEMGYDGVVIESWSRWAAYGILHDSETRNLALQFIKQLGDALHSVEGSHSKRHLELVYVIGPPRSEKLQEHDFGPGDLQILSDAVDGFSLMTYDFSNPQNPGPNAPLAWIQSTLQLLLAKGSVAQNLASKIFLGINFYGNDFILTEGSGGAIIGRAYLSLLEKHKPLIKWEKNSGEHFFLYSDDDNKKHAVFYPSTTSISARVEEARSWGTGISIWEIGQGLDHFLDLL